ncbi:unnamed protein product [Brassica rapa subsp. trilocularis]
MSSVSIRKLNFEIKRDNEAKPEITPPHHRSITP